MLVNEFNSYPICSPRFVVSYFILSAAGALAEVAAGECPDEV